jgi:hypothetical protein
VLVIVRDLREVSGIKEGMFCNVIDETWTVIYEELKAEIECFRPKKERFAMSLMVRYEELKAEIDCSCHNKCVISGRSIRRAFPRLDGCTMRVSNCVE